jgi:hypothetical protein
MPKFAFSLLRAMLILMTAAMKLGSLSDMCRAGRLEKALLLLVQGSAAGAVDLEV